MSSLSSNTVTPTPPTQGLTSAISPEECAICFATCKLEKMSEDLDKLIETLLKMEQDDLGNDVNIPPVAPVVQERIADLNRSLCDLDDELNLDVTGTGAAANNWQCRRIRGALPLGFYRKKYCPRAHKIMKKAGL